jgi:histidine triad (HIT) family protein
MHLIPRYKGDKVGLGWKMGQLDNAQKEEILAKIREE